MLHGAGWRPSTNSPRVQDGRAGLVRGFDVVPHVVSDTQPLSDELLFHACLKAIENSRFSSRLLKPHHEDKVMDHKL